MHYHKCLQDKNKKTSIYFALVFLDFAFLENLRFRIGLVDSTRLRVFPAVLAALRNYLARKRSKATVILIRFTEISSRGIRGIRSSQNHKDR